ncbi:MFS transporter [Pseudonocardia nigra]|uniref:MFS transporter n=1 Tax=Pseudonocardia nigra TaxID=1921578 RepID=UPI0027E2556C|nr:MFS transporter [Pseudonocardia nigra]
MRASKGGFAITNAVGSYLFSSYLSTYLTSELGHTKDAALVANTVAVGVLVVLLPVSGLLTDRIGRKPMLLTGAGLFAALSLPAFLLAAQSGFAAALAAELVFVVALFFIAVPVTVSIAEMFPTQVRCTAGAIS